MVQGCAAWAGCVGATRTLATWKGPSGASMSSGCTLGSLPRVPLRCVNVDYNSSSKLRENRLGYPIARKRGKGVCICVPGDVKGSRCQAFAGGEDLVESGGT